MKINPLVRLFAIPGIQVAAFHLLLRAFVWAISFSHEWNHDFQRGMMWQFYHYCFTGIAIATNVYLMCFPATSTEAKALLYFVAMGILVLIFEGNFFYYEVWMAHISAMTVLVVSLAFEHRNKTTI